MELLSAYYPNQFFTTYECRGAYNAKNDIQGLTLMLFMNKKFSNNGRKIALYNKECNFFGGKRLGLNLIDLSDSSASGRLVEGKLYPMTPQTVWDETARWYFREQP